MAAGQYDFTIEQGANLALVVQVNDTDGDAMDLTGATSRGKIRETATDTTVVATLTCTVRSPGTLGIVDVTMIPADTAAIAVDSNTSARKTSTKYAYDIEVVFSATNVLRVLEGVVSVSPEVTY